MYSETMSYCGTYCETCYWKEKLNCKGCKALAGEVFWGTCSIAKCGISKNLYSCEECISYPCETR